MAAGAASVVLKILKYICFCILFPPVFLILFFLSLIKVVVFSPFVFLVIAFGDAGILMGLWPLHLVWSVYCIARTKKFGPFLKCFLIPLVPIPIALWTVVGVVGSVIMGIGYAVVWPVMETFRAISREGVSIPMRFIRCFTDGTYSNVWGACTIVRDFADFSFHSYFSVMDELMEAKEEKPIEIKVIRLPGCVICAIFGLVVDVPVITLIVLYKAPVLLIKGWYRLGHDLIGREGPFLETFCVPIAGLFILLWPAVVFLATFAGIVSSFAFGCFAAVVAYQENSTKRGLLYVVASISLFDESTNDFLYLREGSCFPRPRYRQGSTPKSTFPVKGLHEQLDAVRSQEPLIRTASQKILALSSIEILDNFFRSCQQIGTELLRAGAIDTSDLEAWQHSKNKLVHIGIPAYSLLECFICSIKSGSPGLLMRDNVELTSLNRPEGRVFDWLFEPMILLKDQLKGLNLIETEELYLYKFCLYSGDKERVEAWHNGGFPSADEIRRAQLEGIGRRLQGFCLTLSRLPTSRRRFSETAKEIQQEKEQSSHSFNAGDDEDIPV